MFKFKEIIILLLLLAGYAQAANQLNLEEISPIYEKEYGMFLPKYNNSANSIWRSFNRIKQLVDPVLGTSINTTVPLLGGGDLTATRTLSLTFESDLKLSTSNRLDTIQGIRTTDGPTFDHVHLTTPTPSSAVKGAASSTDNAIVRWDSTSGGLIQNSAVTSGDNDCDWTSWTPVLSVSGGTAPTYTRKFISRYKRFGKTIHWWIFWENTSGGTAGAGVNTLNFTLPVSYSVNYVSDNLGNIGRSFLGRGYSFEEAGTITWVEVQTAIDDVTRAGFCIVPGASRIVGNDQSSTKRTIIAWGQYEVDN
jgi:hypothetical protein